MWNRNKKVKMADMYTPIITTPTTRSRYDIRNYPHNAPHSDVPSPPSSQQPQSLPPSTQQHQSLPLALQHQSLPPTLQHQPLPQHHHQTPCAPSVSSHSSTHSPDVAIATHAHIHACAICLAPLNAVAIDVEEKQQRQQQPHQMSPTSEEFDMRPQAIDCMHVFHRTCIANAIFHSDKEVPECPMCRNGINFVLAQHLKSSERIPAAIREQVRGQQSQPHNLAQHLRPQQRHLHRQQQPSQQQQQQQRNSGGGNPVDDFASNLVSILDTFVVFCFDNMLVIGLILISLLLLIVATSIRSMNTRALLRRYPNNKQPHQVAPLSSFVSRLFNNYAFSILGFALCIVCGS